MRARMALRYSGVSLRIQEVSLKEKPAEMLRLSPKGTVPVLALADGKVIEESLDIMRWALAQHDPDDWMMMRGGSPQPSLAEALVAENDGVFKQALDRYKYFIRYPEQPRQFYRSQGEIFLGKLEQQLGASRYLCRDTCSYADIAIFPFIRQFASADEAWFAHSPYSHLRGWLNDLVRMPLFIQIMEKTK